MAKKKKSSGDYDGWILRLIDKVEDIGFSFNSQKWLDFARTKILGSDYGPTAGKLTKSQRDSLLEMAGQVWEVGPTKLNIIPEYVTRYRDRAGRFIRVEKTEHGLRNIRTGRFTSARPEKAERYRNLGGYGQKVGTAVSASKINAEIQRAKENKTWLRG